MAKKKASKKVVGHESTLTAGQFAKSSTHTLRSYAVGALPIMNRLLDRMDLENHLQQHLRADGSRMKIPTTTGLLLLVRNFLLSREPMYGVGEWAQRHAPDLLGLSASQLQYLNDDRVGRCLDRLFEGEVSDLVMSVVRHIVKEFDLSLDELHNDSTTVSFFGSYDDAAEESEQRGRPTVALTYGHSKMRRPDLKQLLYALTVTNDGGVPVYFTTHSGNTVDDQTHQETWNLLKELVGSPDFLYVADCKLATAENMKYIAKNQGRFISVLPRSRKEDSEFRKRLQEDPESVPWDLLYQMVDENEEVVDELSVCPEEIVTNEKCRLWWFHSTRKARTDHYTRLKHIQRATVEFESLRQRMQGPRSRLRTIADVKPQVDKILQETQTEDFLHVDIREYEAMKFRQAKPGRPGKNTKYVKKTYPVCDLSWETDEAALVACHKTDGVFPLITNCTDMTPEEVLRAYKRQPIIEKRFSQLKTDFCVAPVCLKNVSRIQAMLCVYFFALMLQTLLERELRHAMQAADLESLPLYPEGRECKAPTTRRILDILEPIQRHTLTMRGHSETVGTELSELQRMILELLDVPHEDYAL